MSFLALPSELRLQVYGYAAHFNHESFLHYLGLYMSCRQIKHEMDHECLRIQTLQLRKINSKINASQGIRCETPVSPKSMRNLCVVFSKGMCKLPMATDTLQPPRCLVPLLDLHLHSLTLLFERASSTRVNQENINWIYSHMLGGGVMGVEGTLNARRLIIDVGTLDQDLEIVNWFLLVCISTFRHDATVWREKDWVVDRAGAKVVFERVGSRVPKVECKTTDVYLALAGPRATSWRSRKWTLLEWAAVVLMGCLGHWTFCSICNPPR